MQPGIPRSLQQDPQVLSWARRLAANPSVTSVSAAYTALATDRTVLADATAGAFTVTLPAASENKGLVLTVKRINAAAENVTIACNGSDTVETAATVTLSARWAYRMVQSDGTSTWVILSSS